MLHGHQEFVQTIVVVDNICSQHIVIPEDGGREGALQVMTPRQSSHLRGVATAATGVP